MGVEAEERDIYEAGHYLTQDLEKKPPCNAEDNLRTGLVVIEA